MATYKVHDPKLGNVSSILHKVFMNSSDTDYNASSTNNQLVDVHLMPSSQPFSTLYISWLCVAAIIFIPGVMANGMILLALFKIEKLRVASNYLIGSLAVADLMMMLGMAGFVLSDVFVFDISEKVNAFLWPSVDLLVGSASIINLAGVSFDRAVAVFKPLQYHERSNLKKTSLTIKSIWAYSISLFILSMLRCVIDAKAYNLAVLYLSYAFSFLLPFAVILISYVLILYATVKNVRLSRNVDSAVYNAALRLSDGANVKFARIRKLRIQELKIAGNFIIILLPFVACWAVFFGTHLYEDITMQYRRSDLHEWFLITLPWISSSVNPLIYILSVSSLRNGCKKLLCRGRYLSRAKETIITTLQSMRSSTVERGFYHVPTDKKSLFQRVSLLSKFSRKPKSGAGQEVAHVAKEFSVVEIAETKQVGTDGTHTDMIVHSTARISTRPIFEEADQIV